MKILVLGGSGMLGHAIQKCDPRVIIHGGRCHVDLTDMHAALQYISDENPDVVLNAAGQVGSASANQKSPADFYINNIKIVTNVIQACQELKISRLLTVSSVCAYPEDSVNLTEMYLLQGPPREQCYGYSFAKRAAYIYTRACNEQYNTKYSVVMLGNMYGPHDNFQLDTAHVIPALLRRGHEAKENKSMATVKGAGHEVRQFTYSEDAAKALLWVVQQDQVPDLLNVGTEHSYTISMLVSWIGIILKKEKGLFKYDRTETQTSRAMGMNMNCLTELGYGQANFRSLTTGLKETYNWYVNNH